MHANSNRTIVTKSVFFTLSFSTHLESNCFLFTKIHRSLACMIVFRDSHAIWDTAVCRHKRRGPSLLLYLDEDAIRVLNEVDAAISPGYLDQLRSLFFDLLAENPLVWNLQAEVIDA